jgi:hypothetical protein
MRRLFVALLVGAALALGARAVLAAEPLPHTGRVLISVQGDVVIPAGDHADAVLVVGGNADIRGEVNTIVVVEGTADLIGARAESVIAIRSRIEVGAGTSVSDKVMRLDSTVHQTGDAEIAGGITDLAGSLLAAGAVLAPALFLLWLGFGLATIAWALLAAGVAGRQLREAEQILATEPVQAFLIGLVSLILLPILAILLMVTVIGAPLGVGLLIVAMPLLAFAGYLVAATWIGGWIVREATTRTDLTPERPFVSVFAGVLLLTFIGLVPVLSIVGAVVSLLGFGAVIRLLARTLRGTPRPIGAGTQPLAAPTGA